jgi:hypothetical protein
MQIPIVVEPTAENGFRASTGAPLNLQVEASNQDEAVGRLRQLIERRVADGAVFMELTIGQREHPLARFAGIFKDDPLLQEWKDAMAEYRRQVEAEEDTP